MGNDLESGLSIGLGVELDEDSAGGLEVAGAPVSLGSLGQGKNPLELGTTPLDGVNLLSEETKGSKTVSRTHLGRNPAGGIASLDIAGAFGGSGSLVGLEVLLVGSFEELDLSLLQLHGNLVALLDELVQVLGVTSNPDVLDGVAEGLANASLVEILLGDGGEQHGAGGESVGVLGREEEGLAEVDVKDALAHNHVHDETIDEPCDKGMRVQAVRRILNVKVAVRDGLELGLAIAAGGIDREEDGPGDAGTDEADGGADSEVSQEEVGVDALVLEGVDIGDLPEVGDPTEEARRHAGASFTGMIVSGLDVERDTRAPSGVRPDKTTYCSRREPRYVLGA